MPVKEWFRQMQLLQLYIILGLTIIFFITELVVSHITHALTLLMDSYHMLCNILSLAGCIITIKYGKGADSDCDLTKAPSVASSVGEELTTPSACQDKKKKSSPSRASQEKKLKNTFGWARIDVIFMVVSFVFMASFCFSIFVESLQTLVHIDHQDEIHHPITVLCLGSAGVVLNGLCYLLIGGYTFHQGSFLYVTESGDVVLNKVMTESVRRGQRRLSRTRNVTSSPPRQRQGFIEMFRDVFGCFLVILCALIILFVEDKNVAKFVDPVLALISAGIIVILSYPYMKESCLILLQTIPDSINIDALKKQLLEHFPDIVNVHDFHVWQLTANKVVTTVHIIFQNPKVYHKIMKEVKEFFLDNGITQVTIQPEFYSNYSASTESLAESKPPLCLMTCQEKECKDNLCCPDILEPEKESSIENLNNSSVILKSIKILNEGRVLNSTTSLMNLNSNKMAKNLDLSKSEDNIHIQPNLTSSIEHI